MSRRYELGVEIIRAINVILDKAAKLSSSFTQFTPLPSSSSSEKQSFLASLGELLQCLHIVDLPLLLRFMADFVITSCWHIGKGERIERGSVWEGKEGDEEIKNNVEKITLYGRIIGSRKEILGTHVNEYGQIVLCDGSLSDVMTSFYGLILNQVNRSVRRILMRDENMVLILF